MSPVDPAPPPVPPVAEAPGKRRRPLLRALLIGAAACVALVFLAFVVLGMLLEAGLIPDERVYTADTLPARGREAIASICPLEEGEQLVFAYFGGFVDWEEDGQFLTDRRAVSWMAFVDEPSVDQVRLDEVEWVSHAPSPFFLVDGLLTFLAGDTAVVQMWPAQDGGEERVLSWVRDRLPDVEFLQ